MAKKKAVKPWPSPVYSPLSTPQLSRLYYVALAEWGEARRPRNYLYETLGLVELSLLTRRLPWAKA